MRIAVILTLELLAKLVILEMVSVFQRRVRVLIIVWVCIKETERYESGHTVAA